MMLYRQQVTFKTRPTNFVIRAVLTELQTLLIRPNVGSF